MKNKVVQTFCYIFTDLLASVATWLAFIYFRKKYIEPNVLGIDLPVVLDDKALLGLALIPVFWIFLHWFSGYYRDVFRKSRLKELGQTFLTILIGTIILFFLLFLDDTVANYTTYYKLILFYLGVQFFLTYLFRLTITSVTARRIQRKKIWFNTLIIGSGSKARQLIQDLRNEKISNGNKVIGYIPFNGSDDLDAKGDVKNLGPLNKVKQLIIKNRVEEVIIAIENPDHNILQKLISDLDEKNIKIKIIPDMYDIVSGFVRLSSIFGTPLIDVDAVVMPQWQQSVKRMLDVLVSVLAIMILAPFLLLLVILIVTDSKGSAIYKQQRIGKYGKPFTIYKFRSMRTDAEKDGPALSSGNDGRMTKIGRWLRKLRLDELPQFFNVLKGDMSLVGPRPERQFFIDQIVPQAPHYRLLHRVRPGITSWGQVKYGYAENVDEMIERLKFDILYIENMSLALDFKIIIYTVLTVLKAEGK